jgi:hypothetical protein
MLRQRSNRYIEISAVNVRFTFSGDGICVAGAGLYQLGPVTAPATAAVRAIQQLRHSD